MVWGAQKKAQSPGDERKRIKTVISHKLLLDFLRGKVRKSFKLGKEREEGKGRCELVPILFRIFFSFSNSPSPKIQTYQSLDGLHSNASTEEFFRRRRALAGRETRETDVFIHEVDVRDRGIVVDS